MANLIPKPCKWCGTVFKRVRRVQQFCSVPCYLWSKATPGDADACWEWTGARNKEGYGVAYENYTTLFAHRMSYEAHHGPLGSFFALHRCDNPPCINPAHLFAGTQADNVRDRDAKGRGRWICPNLKGSESPAAKVTELEVIEIRSLYATGLSLGEIASRFPIGKDAVWRIAKRRNWKHI